MYLQRRRRAQPRTTQLGTWAHGLIGELLEDERDFSAEDLCKEGRRFLKQRNPDKNPGPRVGDLVTAVNIALLHRPTPPWQLLGTEMRLGDGAVDAVFWLPAAAAGGDPKFLIDEWKLGRFPDDLAEAGPQVLRYLAAAHDRWGADLVGIRLLGLTYPPASLFWEPGADHPIPLNTTPWWFARPVEMVA